MTTKMDALLEKVHTVHDLGKAMAVLGWDRETNMPPGGLTARIQQLTTLRRIQHGMYTSDEMGELIAAAVEEQSDAAPDSFAYTLLRYLQRDYADQRKLPPEFVRRVSEVSGKAHHAWVASPGEQRFCPFSAAPGGGCGDVQGDGGLFRLRG
jgi:carboxypeptidase Taq